MGASAFWRTYWSVSQALFFNSRARVKVALEIGNGNIAHSKVRARFRKGAGPFILDVCLS